MQAPTPNQGPPLGITNQHLRDVLTNITSRYRWRTTSSGEGSEVDASGKDQHAVELLMPYDRKVHVLHGEKS